MPPQSPYIRPHEIMELLSARILPKRRFEQEPERQPKWAENLLTRHLYEGTSYWDAFAKIAWEGTREVACKVPESKWHIHNRQKNEKVPIEKGQITMALDWPNGHPFVDFSKGWIWPKADLEDMEAPYRSVYKKFAQGFRGATIGLNRRAVEQAMKELQYDWGLSCEGKEVTPPPRRNKSSAKGRLQTALWHYTDKELQDMTAGKAMKIAEEQTKPMHRTNCDEVLREYKRSRGITPHLPKGKNTTT